VWSYHKVVWSYHLVRECEMDKDPADMTEDERAAWKRRMASHAELQGISLEEFLARWADTNPDSNYTETPSA
jgi:hypothetical protein